MAEDMVPGAEPSYQLAKTIYSWHPIGKKMVDTPLAIAQSQKRIIAITKGPEDRVKEAFLKQWDEDKADRHILNTARLARIYGIGAIVLGALDQPTDEPLDFKTLADLSIYFNEVDPLNTAGSLVLNQDPNAPDFQKHGDIAVNGKVYHRSRCVVLMNEDPLYIEYSTSAFGYVGRSVYQRALFPLKSFIQTMITDDMISRKAGLLVAKIKQAGSMVNSLMERLTSIKRRLLNESVTNQTVSIGEEDSIESLNLNNIDGAGKFARTNILENIALAADMPAKIINNETFAEGFGEGTEDAKNVARYIDTVRNDLKPIYDWFDKIIQYRAWNKEFYATIQADFPEEYGTRSFEDAFYEWSNNFTAEWPSLLIEPDSEKAKSEKVKLESLISMVEVLSPTLDPSNRARVFQWVQDNVNSNKMLFSTPLNLDFDAMVQFAEQQQAQQQQMQQQAMQAGPSGGGEAGGDKPSNLKGMMGDVAGERMPTAPRAMGA
jgi:hypothetical protein